MHVCVQRPTTPHRPSHHSLPEICASLDSATTLYRRRTSRYHLDSCHHLDHAISFFQMCGTLTYRLTRAMCASSSIFFLLCGCLWLIFSLANYFDSGRMMMVGVDCLSFSPPSLALGVFGVRASRILRRGACACTYVDQNEMVDGILFDELAE